MPQIGYPVACYKKLDDDSEEVIKIFRTFSEATAWAVENKIMCKGAVSWTINHNTYIDKPKNTKRRAKYYNRDLYRFAKIIRS